MTSEGITHIGLEMLLPNAHVVHGHHEIKKNNSVQIWWPIYYLFLF